MNYCVFTIYTFLCSLLLCRVRYLYKNHIVLRNLLEKEFCFGLELTFQSFVVSQRVGYILLCRSLHVHIDFGSRSSFLNSLVIVIVFILVFQLLVFCNMGYRLEYLRLCFLLYLGDNADLLRFSLFR